MEPLTVEAQKQLMLLMTQNQRRIFGYLYTLVPDRHAAEDLLQETSLVICEKFHEFTTGTDFVAWACQIAWWRVRAAQKYARSRSSSTRRCWNPSRTPRRNSRRR